MSAGELAFGSEDVLVAGEVPESHLVERCRMGDARAFARLVALHEGMVFNLAARLLGDVEEARDAAQDVFLQVYRQLSRFQGRSSLKTWIYRIVVNNCRNRQRWWRRRRMDRSCSMDSLSPADQARLAARSSQPSPFELVRRRERAARLQKALDALSYDHRVVLLLREVEGLGNEEIAATLGLASGTVKSRLARAREALRRQLLPSLEEGECA
jgi:RNA polymerase sigma-70 factor (ECF subfamily)